MTGAPEVAAEEPPIDKRSQIRSAAEVFYDLQKLRIATNNRFRTSGRPEEQTQEEADFLAGVSTHLDGLEALALQYAKRHLKKHPISKWLEAQRGCGPTMATVIVASFDIHKADTVSKFWAYSGLGVMPDGRAQRRIKGQKVNYNPWLRTKLVGVLADCFIKAARWDPEQQCYIGGRGKPVELHTVWRRFYDDYKHRKKSQRVPVCMACEGTGKASKPETDAEAAEREYAEETRGATVPAGACPNCEGTGGPAPWGRSDGHRAAAAKRYMIKMFLIELHTTWRTLEGLPVRAPYREAVLGMPPHSGRLADHAAHTKPNQ